MSRCEFAILPQSPRPGEIYESYEPQKYPGTWVEDDLLSEILLSLRDLPVYWHQLQRPARGLEECGISLIPPSSLPLFLAVLGEDVRFCPLISLLRQAEREGRYVLVYGL